VAKKPVAKRPPAKVSNGRPAGLFTWIAVGLVVVVVAVLVIIKVTGSTATATGSSGFQAADPATVSELTTVPASVFNTIGVTSPVVPVTPPQAIKGQPELTGTSNGKTLPEVFYFGAEYCPFCAAQRWPTIIALSRFGTFKGLGNMTSSSSDVDPSTPTFTFLKSTYTSSYLVFKSIEFETNVFDSATNSYTKLQTPTKTQLALFDKYDTSKYIKGISSSDDGSIPFMSIGNKFLVSGASYTPATLAGLSRNTIAAGLTTTSSPITAAIISSANYLTASFCTLTNNLPSSVCTSPGVLAAKKTMKI
jgi:thiol-disulfide isomerase/thioredoxin